MRLNAKRAKYLRKVAREQISDTNIKWFNGYQFDNSKRPNNFKAIGVVQILLQKITTKIEAGSEQMKELIAEAQEYVFPPLNLMEPSGKHLYRKFKRSFKTSGR